jgi:transposase
VGVDTHGDLHVACAIDQLGRRLAIADLATTPTGYRAALEWARKLVGWRRLGWRAAAAMGRPGALPRCPGPAGLGVNRPDRCARRRRGKSDPVDAEAAAGAVLAGQVTAMPKAGSHLVEMVRCLRVARATAVKARSQAINALRALVVTAAPELREQLRELPATKLAGTAAQLQPGPILTTTAATKLALRCWASDARRWIRNWPDWTPSWTT